MPPDTSVLSLDVSPTQQIPSLHTGLLTPFPHVQAGLCACEEGYTEVMRSDGVLDQCMLIPVLEVEKADVKTSWATHPTRTTAGHPGTLDHDWFLQPFGPGESSMVKL